MGEPCAGGREVLLCLAVLRLDSETLLDRWGGLGLTGGFTLEDGFDVFFTSSEKPLSFFSSTISGLIPGSTSGLTGWMPGSTSGLTGLMSGSTSGLTGLIADEASSTACAVSPGALVSAPSEPAFICGGLAALTCVVGEEAIVLVGGGGRGMVGGGGISLVAGRFTL